MDWYGLFICTAMFLCSVDGANAINYAYRWLKLKGVVR